MAFDDTPRIWTGDEMFNEEEADLRETTTDVVIADNTPQLPSLEEQEQIVKESNVSNQGKSLLGALVELNKTATVLAQIQNDETIEMQNKVIQATCTQFIHSRMHNNQVAEQLKNKLLGNLIENIDVLDLETQAKIYNDLTEVSAIDAQQALAKISGGAGTMPSNSGGINLTINNATGENSGITQNQLSVGNNAPIANLSTISNLNKTVTDWGKVPTKADVIDTKGTEK